MKNICFSRLPLLLLLLAILFSLSACETLGYYRQAVSGHLSLLHQRQSISHHLQSPTTSPELKTQLEKILAIRSFAKQNLLLPVKKQYNSYVTLDRKYVVWNIFAAPELSLKALTWCYPIAGCAHYRGYYKQQQAQQYAQKLQTQGYDVYVAGIAAYSTLGWFSDPVLSSFINRSDAELARLLFHELAHQLLYIKDDTPFNESFATVVAQEGVKRWMALQNNPIAYEKFLADQIKQQEFISLVSTYRDRLQEVYQSSRTDPEKREQKQALIEQLKLLGIKQSNYTHWFNQAVNNAQLNTVSTYFEQVPGLTRLLEKNHSDLALFYASCRKLAAESKGQRMRYLGKL